MKLVIVESPTKARTISKFLGNDYVIKASMGHIMDLPKSTLGVDIKHNFAPEFELSKDKLQIIKDIQKSAKEADEIILATDPDREGEAIAKHIQELLTDNKLSVSRIVFHEITKEAINNALKNPGVVNEKLVDAQTARRVLDRLVGYKLSPILWQKIRRGLSAGRVQSVALRLIVEREREIEKFEKEEYWTIQAIMSKDKLSTEFDLFEINGQKIDLTEKLKLYDGEYTFSKTTIDSQEKADNIVADLSTKQFIVDDVLKKVTKRSPQSPFTTSTLQQQASQKLGFSGRRTMSIAQKLYEEGFITYHRTDSVSMSSSAVSQIRKYVEKEYGKHFIPEKPRFYKAKQKLAQEAHECIRPTAVDQISNIKSQISNIKTLGNAGGKLYELIWIRAVASQMADAIIESTTVFADAQSASANLYRFKTTGSVLVFEGFLKVNPFGLQDKKLPNFAAGEQLKLLNSRSLKHETAPPPRYNDASIIKSLEEEGIGRPSTYATIISTIEARNYIERDQGKFLPTAVGIAVNDFLVKNFSAIDDIPFTASMEDLLDNIANGEKEWIPVIRDFYMPFERQLENVKNAERVQIAVEETGEICPKDGAPLVVRIGRFGKFISCKNFPACDYKKQFVQETQYACPACLQAGMAGRIIAKKTKKGRTFYGCSNYPKCTFAVWKLSQLKNDNIKK